MNFRTVYNTTYSTKISSQQLNDIKSDCTENTLLCAGGGVGNTDKLYLIACGNCRNVLQNTYRNKPKYSGSAYWYFTPGYSFGFSPNSTIKQTPVDSSDPSDSLRLSWYIDIYYGGWRLGDIVDLNHDRFYRKYIFIN